MSVVLAVATAVLLLTGGLLCVLSAVGLLRLPETTSRLHALSKAQTLGLLSVLVGTSLQLPGRYALAAGLIAAFQLLTAPVTGHLVSRIAHRTGVVRHRRLSVDELGARLARQRQSEQAAEADGAGDADGG